MARGPWILTSKGGFGGVKASLRFSSGRLGNLPSVSGFAGGPSFVLHHSRGGCPILTFFGRTGERCCRCKFCPFYACHTHDAGREAGIPSASLRAGTSTQDDIAADGIWMNRESSPTFALIEGYLVS